MVSNKLLTLAFIREQSRILLGLKKRGFGEGRWNGFGGKVQAEETIEAAAKRELTEEAGVTVQSLEKIGILMFEFIDDPQLLEVHVFMTDKYTGNIEESDEMRPEWYNLSDIPFNKMWPDDILWFPHMLSGQKFYGYFTFRGMNDITDYTLDVIENLDTVAIPKAARLTKPNDTSCNGST